MDPDAYAEMNSLQNEHWWYVSRRRIISRMISKLNLRQNASILEVGCGTGGNLEMLMQHGKVKGVEKNTTALEIARQDAGSSIFQNVEIESGALPYNLPFGAETFDLICLFDVLEHIEADFDALVALKDRLNDEGRIVLTVPAYQFLFGKHDRTLHHKRRYTKSTLLKIHQKGGLHIDYMNHFNFLLAPLIIFIRLYQKCFSTRGNSEAAMPNRLLNFLLKKIMCLESFLVTSIILPFGISIICVSSCAADE